jgi:hypothetical protein
LISICKGLQNFEWLDFRVDDVRASLHPPPCTFQMEQLPKVVTNDDMILELEQKEKNTRNIIME